MTKAFYFPLATNAGYFDTPQQYLSLSERVKQAALLYDKVIFEDGIFEAKAWQHENMHVYSPVDNFTIEQLEQQRASFKPTGGVDFLQIRNDSTGQLLHQTSGEIARRYRAEFYSFLHQLNAERLPWVELDYTELSQEGKNLATQISNSFDRCYQHYYPDHGSGLRRLILKALSHDIVVSMIHGAALSTSAEFASILKGEANSQQAPGIAALSIAIPDLSCLPWNEVVEIRDCPSMVALRSKLFDWEAAARSAMSEGEATDEKYIKNLSDEILNELAKELRSARPKSTKVVATVALDLIVGCIPFLSAVSNASRIANAAYENENSWVSAFLRLRNQ